MTFSIISLFHWVYSLLHRPSVQPYLCCNRDKRQNLQGTDYWRVSVLITKQARPSGGSDGLTWIMPSHSSRAEATGERAFFIVWLLQWIQHGATFWIILWIPNIKVFSASVLLLFVSQCSWISDNKLKEIYINGLHILRNMSFFKWYLWYVHKSFDVFQLRFKGTPFTSR